MTDQTTTPIDQLGGGQVSITTQIGPWAFVPMWINYVGLSDSEYRIYVVLRSYADRSGTCWPLARTIAKDAGKSLGTVRNAIQRFRKLGLLTTRPRHRDDGGLAGAIYTLTDLPPARTAQNGTDQQSPTSHSAPPLHPPVHPPYIPQCTPPTSPSAPKNTPMNTPEEQRSTQASSAPPAPPDPAPAPDKPALDDSERPDVDRICEHLANRVEANGSLRPTITKTWRTSARLLLDKDGRTIDQVIAAIDWCQDDEFWRTVILSMPKLRQRYDQLRLAATRPTRTAARSRYPSTEERLAADLALIAELAAEDAAAAGAPTRLPELTAGALW